jgi:hypothetical protein
MTGFSVFEALFGAVAVYIGIRLVIRRELPIVSEGDDKPMGWLRGHEAVVAGCAVVCVGIGCLAVALGLVHLA